MKKVTQYVLTEEEHVALFKAAQNIKDNIIRLRFYEKDNSVIEDIAKDITTISDIL